MTSEPGSFLDVPISREDEKRWRRRRALGPVFSGPCLVLSRLDGQALDAGAKAAPGDHPALCTAQAMPWQRWLVERQRSGFSKIQSDAFGLYLQRDAKPTDGSEVTLAEAYSANTQLWALRPTEDETAFVVAASTGNFVLDGTTGDGLRTAPRLRTASGAPWQQWLIVRLPLANEKKPPAED